MSPNNVPLHEPASHYPHQQPGENDAPQGPDLDDRINLTVNDNNNVIHFKVKQTTCLDKLMEAFCNKSGKALSEVRFLWEGERIIKGQTPRDLGLTNGDIIEVHSEQVGGGDA
ncbi:MAG: hypothetical protein M1834_007795 [Cirrosporium novae-zelandiae]|nr:MAG: hypothetical protein M1834_007795 [Cirrosporium novae-zelandiae]